MDMKDKITRLRWLRENRHVPTKLRVKAGQTVMEAVQAVKDERRAEILNEAAINCAKAVESARLDEREQCAKIAESQYADAGYHGYYRTAGEVIADRIRNQKE